MNLSLILFYLGANLIASLILTMFWADLVRNGIWLAVEARRRWRSELLWLWFWPVLGLYNALWNVLKLFIGIKDLFQKEPPKPKSPKTQAVNVCDPDCVPGSGHICRAFTDCQNR